MLAFPGLKTRSVEIPYIRTLENDLLLSFSLVLRELTCPEDGKVAMGTKFKQEKVE